VIAKVPAEIVVVPEYVFTPLKFNTPEPTLVSAPFVVVPVAPANVKVFVVISKVPVVPAVIVNALSDVAVEPVYCKVPPPNTKLVAALVAFPKLPATPPSPIVATLNVPALIVVTPVNVFVPDKVNLPAPALVSAKILLPSLSAMIPVIVLPVVTLALVTLKVPLDLIAAAVKTSVEIVIPARAVVPPTAPVSVVVPVLFVVILNVKAPLIVPPKVMFPDVFVVIVEFAVKTVAVSESPIDIAAAVD